MEMERINEDTIRVVIGNDDLNERGIRVPRFTRES